MSAARCLIVLIAFVLLHSSCADELLPQLLTGLAAPAPAAELEAPTPHPYEELRAERESKLTAINDALDTLRAEGGQLDQQIELLRQQGRTLPEERKAGAEISRRNLPVSPLDAVSHRLPALVIVEPELPGEMEQHEAATMRAAAGGEHSPEQPRSLPSASELSDPDLLRDEVRVVEAELIVQTKNQDRLRNAKLQLEKEITALERSSRSASACVSSGTATQLSAKRASLAEMSAAEQDMQRQLDELNARSIEFSRKAAQAKKRRLFRHT
ncbi:unnamed protein product [Vitrella brassicaformis CCMP3155]|uniref:Uncharacterized protein n=1 Tax=Vitrella brassicaformis (strain CCMP3155) TaxID=1169540 RepID=A0A0G4EL28_VITBC|nr:unnamed protein product [Vitrella brassicaformis CCMP3155]|eukprot:CEL97657.1 unnamed protein product [Vitrella brassicaformis CCMP3155]